MQEEISEIVIELSSISERLSDLAMESLRAAIKTDGDDKTEKNITKARRSIEKARTLLSGQQ